MAPQAYQKQFENERVKVTRVHYAPHETLAEHEHPGRPSVYVYLNDGGPVLFKHQHGESGDYAATRGATKAGSYRLALGRNETHIVENRSELPSDFLQVELKTDIDPKTFSGRRFRDDAADHAHSSAKVEYEEPRLRILVFDVPARLPASHWRPLIRPCSWHSTLATRRGGHHPTVRNHQVRLRLAASTW